MRNQSLCYLLASACLGAMLHQAAYAQVAPAGDGAESQIEDIIVTAQKRRESLQKVPIAVAAVSGAALESRGIKNVIDLGTITPGLQIATPSGNVIPVLRGVGNRAETVGNEASVSTYVDGVYFARLQAGFFTLNNVERVEVLKGPQGTLFGRNSSGGVIQIITPDPSHETSVKGSVGYGRFNAFTGDIYATTGLSETMAIDLSVAGRTDSGSGDNVATGHRTGYDDGVIARSKLLFQPSDATKITLIGFYAGSKVSGQGSTYPGTTSGTISTPFELFDPGASGFSFYDQRSSVDIRHITKTVGTSLRIEQELPFARLTSISAYTHEKESGYFDGEYGPRPDFNVFLGSHVNLFTQEVQLSSLESSALKWIVGGFYYHNNSVYDASEFRSPSNLAALGFGPGLNSYAAQKARSYAAFGQASYEVLPKLTATGGIRYTRDKVSADGYIDLNLPTPFTVVDPPAASTKTSRVTFRLALDYQFTNDVLGYASFNRSYKTPNFNLLTYNPVPNKPETIDAYEVGFKSDLFDRRLRLNGAAFYYKIGSPQVQLIQNGTVFLSNGGGARVYGAEFDGQLIIADGLTGRFGATFLDSKYTDYANAPSGPLNPNTNPANGPVGGTVSPFITVDARGNHTPLSSPVTFNIGLDYRMETASGDVFVTVDYAYTDKFYWEPDNFLRQKSYGLLSAQVKYAPSDAIAFRIWGKNLTNEKYAVNGATQEGPSGYPFTPGKPVTYGIAVDFRF